MLLLLLLQRDYINRPRPAGLRNALAGAIDGQRTIKTMMPIAAIRPGLPR